MATTARPRGPADAAESAALTHRQILTIFTGLMLGLFLAALDQTIVATAMRTVADDLKGLSLQAWVTTAYLITSTITTPLYGKLSDLYGRKQFFLLAISLFILGSALCGTATSMYQLAGYRAFQGLGAGGLFSLALAIIGDIVSPRERARYQGYFLAVFGMSSVLGPVIGGFFAGQDKILSITGWRWIFYVNVPIGLAALVVVARVLNLPHTRREHRIDWLGALTLVVGLVPLLIVAEQGRTWGWGSGRSMLCYVVGVIGLALFVFAERRIGDDALIPLRFFRNRTFSLGSLVGVVIGMGMFGGIVCLPLYLQIVKGASPTKAGLLLIPATLGIMLGSVISGQAISRTGRYKIFPVIGSALLVVALLLFSQVGADTPLWRTSLVMLLFGLGLGGNMQPLVLAVQNAVPPRDIGVATASATFFRQMGGTLGTAIFLSILFSSVSGRIAAAFRTIAPTASFQAALHDPTVLADPVNRAVIDGLRTGQAGGSSLQDSSFIQHIDPRLARPFQVGFSQAMDLVFLVGAVVVLVALVLVVFLPELPLSTQSGLQRLATEAAEAAAAQAADEDQLVVDPATAGAPGPGQAVIVDRGGGRPPDMKTTWKPQTENGHPLSSEDRKELPDSAYAFPKQRKEPLTDSAHVRNALARFDQVQDVSDAERDQAFANIRKAAEHYDVDIAETDWRQLGRRPHTSNPAHSRGFGRSRRDPCPRRVGGSADRGAGPRRVGDGPGDDFGSCVTTSGSG
jgi:EmrB/QacA subfamily drug resistance transporter